MELLPENSFTKSIWTCSIILALCLPLMAYSIKTFLKVYKNFKTQDMTLFLTSLCHLLSSIFLTMTNIFALISIIKMSKQDIGSEYYIQIYRALVSFNIVFIAIAFQFDIFKWLIFLISSKISKQSISQYDYELQLQKSNKTLKIALIIVQVVTLASCFIFFLQMILIAQKYDEDKFQQIVIQRNVFFSVLSVISIIVYAIIFFKLMSQLNLSYPQFYRKNRKTLLILYTCITFSLISRTVFFTLFCLNSFLKQMLDSVVRDTMFFPLINFSYMVTVFMLPQYVMLYSLNNSISQKQQMLLQRRHSQQLSTNQEEELTEEYQTGQDELKSLKTYAPHISKNTSQINQSDGNQHSQQQDFDIQKSGQSSNIMDDTKFSLHMNEVKNLKNFLDKLEKDDHI